MQHIYLTKEEIDRAKELKQITEVEKDELYKRIAYMTVNRKKIDKK